MDAKTLFTAQELEDLLGETYFYRQSIYRMAEDKKISSYQVNGKSYFSKDEVVSSALNRLANRIRLRFSRLSSLLRISFDENENKTISVYGFPDKSIISVNTTNETEEELLRQLEDKGREVKNMVDVPVGPHHDVPPPPPPLHLPHHGHDIPPPEEVLEVLRRIEDRLIRMEEKLG